MTEEIKEILEALKPHNDIKEYPLYLNRKQQDLLYDYIKNLQQKIDLYENPDDMTLFYMWLDEKSKDKMKQLQQENEILKKNAEHNDKVVDKARWNEMIYKSRCEKANDFIDNYDVFKEFSFPLMKRDIENQIKSSIDYEFNSTFRKKLKNILNGSDVNEKII